MLNRVILVWPYASEDERARVQAQEKTLEDWPPQIDEFVVGTREARVYTLAPFSPPVEPRELGKLYEIRSYTYPTAQIPEVIRTWTEILDERVKFSPLVGAVVRTPRRGERLGAYLGVPRCRRARAHTRRSVAPGYLADVRHRQEAQSRADPVTLSMQNMLVVPASFSPLR